MALVTLHQHSLLSIYSPSPQPGNSSLTEPTVSEGLEYELDVDAVVRRLRLPELIENAVVRNGFGEIGGVLLEVLTDFGKLSTATLFQEAARRMSAVPRSASTLSLHRYAEEREGAVDATRLTEIQTVFEGMVQSRLVISCPPFAPMHREEILEEQTGIGAMLSQATASSSSSVSRQTTHRGGAAAVSSLAGASASTSSSSSGATTVSSASAPSGMAVKKRRRY